MNLADLSTIALLDGITGLLGTERATLARLIAHLVEIDDRRAHLAMACSSLFDFCVRKLGLSEGEAFRRINAARLARRFPVILERIATGHIHLSALVLLRDHLDDTNHESLLEAASGKSKAELQRLIAAQFPRPDVLPSIRKLPERPPVPPAPSAAAVPPLSDTKPTPPLGDAAEKPAPSTAKRQERIEPLSAARFKVQLTATTELKDKLERAARLLGRGHGDVDLASVIERALDELLPSLENERLGTTSHPRPPRKAKHGYVTRSTRREVFARDGERCSFISETGERCPARTHLELDHRHPRALGGSGDASNVRLLCRAHNGFAAERIFGKKLIARKIDMRRRKRASRGSLRPDPSASGPPWKCRRQPGDAPAASHPRSGHESARSLTARSDGRKRRDDSRPPPHG